MISGVCVCELLNSCRYRLSHDRTKLTEQTESPFAEKKTTKMKVNDHREQCRRIGWNAVCWRTIAAAVAVLCLTNVNFACAYLNQTNAAAPYDRPLIAAFDTQYDEDGGNAPVTHNDTQTGHRNGKFLFDALFGIDQNFEYDDVSDDDKIKSCSCGKWCGVSQL